MKKSFRLMLERLDKSIVSDMLKAGMLPSIVTILFCSVLMCTVTWAFFYKSINIKTDALQSAHYSLIINGDENTSAYNGAKTLLLSYESLPTVSGNDLSTVSGNDIEAPDANRLILTEYEINSSDIGENAIAYCCDKYADGYSFTLKAEGTAKNGYCKVTISGEDGNPYYTRQITVGSELILEITGAYGKIIIFEPCWGTSAALAKGETVFGDTDIIECKNLTPIPHNEQEIKISDNPIATTLETEILRNTTVSSGDQLPVNSDDIDNTKNAEEDCKVSEDTGPYGNLESGAETETDSEQNEDETTESEYANEAEQEKRLLK